MKILYVIDTLEVGGTERSLLDIVRHLQDAEPVMCQVYAGAALKREFEAAGISVVSLDLSSRSSLLNAVRRVREVVRREHPNLIHASLFRAQQVSRIVGRLEQIPVVGSLVSDSYGTVRRDAMSTVRRLKLSCVQCADVVTARWVAHFTANSSAIARSNAHALRLKPEGITVIHRGRDGRRFAPGSVAPARIHDRNGELIKRPLFLNVGRLIEGKGQEDLLRAFELLIQYVNDAHLVIAGEGVFRETLESVAADLDLDRSVHLLGQRSDVPELLAAADFFVLPSHYEGHAGALLEAMFSEKPIVATDIPENRESVEHEKTGLLVPPMEPVALAEAMKRLHDYPEEAQQLARNAREVALQRFDIRRIAQQHEELYRQVLRRSCPSRHNHSGRA